MKTVIELKNGAYIVENGKDCDNYPYEALLVIYDDRAFMSGWMPGLGYIEKFEQVALKDGEDLFTKIGIIHYRKL